MAARKDLIRALEYPDEDENLPIWEVGFGIESGKFTRLIYRSRVNSKMTTLFFRSVVRNNVRLAIIHTQIILLRIINIYKSLSKYISS